jgi:hypothetical protein
MRRTILAVIVGLVSSAAMFAGINCRSVDDDGQVSAPETTIVAPTRPVKRGHNIVVRVKPLSPKPKGLVASTYIWIVSPKVEDLDIHPDKTQISFGSGDATDPNHYEVTLVANYLFKGNKLATSETIASISIAGGGPAPAPVPPSPTPTPGPNPQPQPEPGRYGLASFIYNETLSAGLPAADCQKLAGVMSMLASKAAAGGIKTKGQLVNETVQELQTALGSIAPWKKTFDNLANKMNSLGITLIPDCVVAYNELAAGLKARQ